MRRTRRVPVLQSQFSGAGGATISSQQYDYIDIGLTVKVRVRERSERSALLAVTLDLSDQDGNVDNVPIRVAEDYTTAAVVESGGVYLLGSLERRAATEKGMDLVVLGACVNRGAAGVVRVGYGSVH